MSPSSSWRVEPAISEDLMEMLKVDLLANANDLLTLSFYPNPMTERQQQDYLAWQCQVFAGYLQTPNRKYYKAIDKTTSSIIGLAGWHGPISEEDKVHESTTPRKKPISMPSFVNRLAAKDFYDKLEEAKEELSFDPHEDWHLRILSVHPDYQRRGIASHLMQRALTELVDRDGVDAYVESSPAGRIMYEKCGFEEHKKIPMLEGRHVVSVMVRPAKK